MEPQTRAKTECPHEDTLARFVGRELSEPERASVEEHLSECIACQQCISLVVDAFAGSRQPPPAADAKVVVASGTSIGRYVVLDVLGHGAMGIVYAAYDPELDRKVAVKLVCLPSSDTDQPRWQARLVTEGRALAAVSHPNVLPVYDVGSKGDSVFIAMELVEGGTLTQWMRHRRRETAEIIDVFAAAGRGLAAAHANDLIHRDFKPDNVLIGDDGRVRVSDFGLARFSARPLTVPAERAAPVEGAERTRTGSILGTPVYMAPELLSGGQASTRSDQFSFCVALYEALYGTRPFSGTTLSELADSMRVAPAAKSNDRRIPARIRELVLTGLSHEPADRHASVAALVDALTRRPFGRWTASRVLLVGGVGGLAVTVALQSTSRPCRDAAEQLADAWNDTRRREIQEAILRHDASYAAVTWNQVSSLLDQYAADWIAMHNEACEATVVDRVQSAAAMDFRMGCLRRARFGLAAVTELLAEADAEVVRRAQPIVAGLPVLSRCSDTASIEAEVEPPPPHEATAVEQVETLLAQARSAVEAGRLAVAQGRIDGANALLEGVEYQPIRTSLALVDARLRARSGEHEAAEAQLRNALNMASAHRQWHEMHEAANELMYVIGVLRHEPDEALRYRELAAGLADGTPESEAGFETSLGTVLNAAGRYVEAEQAHRRSIALYEQVPDHPRIAKSRVNLGIVLRAQGRLDDAEDELRKALQTSERVHGEEHPETARVRSTLANVFHAQGRFAEAEAEHRLVLAARTNVFGPNHVRVAETRGNLANALAAQDKFVEAEAEHRRSLAALSEALGPDHPNLARAHNNLAAALFSLGRTEEARTQMQRARVLFEQALGPEHPTVLTLRNNIALVLDQQGHSEQAAAELRQLIALRVRTQGHDHLDVAESRSGLCSVLHSLGRYAEAEDEAKKALEPLVAALGEDSPRVGYLRTSLGRALFRQGKLDEAAEAQRKGLGALELVLEPEHTDLAVARTNLAEVLLAASESRPDSEAHERDVLLDEAVSLTEQAYAAHANGSAVPTERARTTFLLARALATRPEDRATRDRAATLAREALSRYSEAGDEHDNRAAEIRDWLRERGE